MECGTGDSYGAIDIHNKTGLRFAPAAANPQKRLHYSGTKSQRCKNDRSHLGAPQYPSEPETYNLSNVFDEEKRFNEMRRTYAPASVRGETRGRQAYVHRIPSLPLAYSGEQSDYIFLNIHRKGAIPHTVKSEKKLRVSAELVVSLSFRSSRMIEMLKLQRGCESFFPTERTRRAAAAMIRWSGGLAEESGEMMGERKKESGRTSPFEWALNGRKQPEQWNSYAQLAHLGAPSKTNRCILQIGGVWEKKKTEFRPGLRAGGRDIVASEAAVLSQQASGGEKEILILGIELVTLAYRKMKSLNPLAGPASTITDQPQARPTSAQRKSVQVIQSPTARAIDVATSTCCLPLETSVFASCFAWACPNAVVLAPATSLALQPQALLLIPSALNSCSLKALLDLGSASCKCRNWPQVSLTLLAFGSLVNPRHIPVSSHLLEARDHIPELKSRNPGFWWVMQGGVLVPLVQATKEGTKCAALAAGRTIQMGQISLKKT
ncbi:hypothetical protein C8R45DRAFT_1148506 [Mycena sanguinolenta]|nr:hypothetical protein C8R45DRAFT_1148506 [Mycena sanguinolenta]